MKSILDQIATHKRQEIQQAKRQRPLKTLSELKAIPIRDFITPLRTNKPGIIAEIKKASPSKGILCAQFDVAHIAQAYAAHGASCLSVLTDIKFFQGDPSYLAIAKIHCTLPILRKDFIIDTYQIYESKALGADCILLIVAMLDDCELQDYCQMAQELGMAVLVESHTLEELERALNLPTPLIGINNRSLHTFQTNIQLSIELSAYVPTEKIIISESGINHQEEMRRLQEYGIHSFLIGESLMRMPNPGIALAQLLNQI